MSAFSANDQRALREAVLVVDDEPQVLAAIEDTLEDEFRVYVETSPKVAIELLRQVPDLSVVLSDQRMPGMSGDEFLAQARELSHASRLLITGYADLEAVVRAVNLGRIFGYVSKPWSPDHLKLAVHKAVEHYRLLRELEEEQELLRQLMDSVPDAIYFKDLEQRYLRINPVHAARLKVADPQAAIGRRVGEFLPPHRAQIFESEDEKILRSGVSVEDRLVSTVDEHGEVRWYSTTKTPIRHRDGRIAGLVGITRDVTARRQVEERVERLNRVYAVLSGINGTIVRIRDRDELFREACRIAVEAGKFRLAWIGALDWSAMRIDPVASSGADPEFVDFIRARLSGRGDALEEDGPSWRAVRSGEPVIVNDVERDPLIRRKQVHVERGIRSFAILPVVVSGRAAAVLALHATEAGFFDAEEMKLLRELAGDIAFALDHIEKAERLDYLAYYDLLTGLANRSLFRERLNQYLREAGPAGETLALVIADVERLRTINESLGRQAGDGLLKGLAERLARGTDRTELARIGVDQFAAVLRRVKGLSEVTRRIDRMWQGWLGEPYQVGQTELRVAAKGGIALFPRDGADADTLLQNAEAALRSAKKTGERHVYHVPKMTAEARETLTLETGLRQALEKGEFVLHYQPKVELETRRIIGVEALIRWNSPEFGLMPPGRFIPLLEETGLILEVGAWALAQAVADQARWRERGLQAPRVAVNVSAIQLRRRQFVATLEETLKHSASPPGIDLEITESLVMEDVEVSIEKLKAVRALGVQIAIDDFGTGYSSLGYLARLPVQTLKIDRSFIVTMLDNPDTMTLVSTILSLARSLRLNVVAEGVDSEEQAKVLRLLRCDAMQGYLFSRPQPWEEMTALLEQQEP